jgi:hypothetical protein
MVLVIHAVYSNSDSFKDFDLIFDHTSDHAPIQLVRLLVLNVVMCKLYPRLGVLVHRINSAHVGHEVVHSKDQEAKGAVVVTKTLLPSLEILCIFLA